MSLVREYREAGVLIAEIYCEREARKKNNKWDRHWIRLEAR